MLFSRNFISISFLLLISTFCSAEVFKIGGSEYLPFVDSKRKDGGASIELIRRIMKSQGHDVELKIVPWARSVKMLETQDIDILPTVWFTEERAKTMNYSESYAANRLTFIKAKGSNYEYDGLPSLHDKSVGIIRDYGYGDEFLNDGKIKFSVTNGLESNVKMVINGRVDLTLEDEIVAKASLDKALLDKVDFTQNALSESPLYITCLKANSKCDTIVSAFNKGLSELKSQDAYDALMKEVGL